jgi:integrase
VAKKLTNFGVQALRARDKYYEVVDGTTGLRLAVFPSGAKSWIARYRRPGSGKPAKLTVGKYPDMPLSTARIRVSEARSAVGKGADPGEDKRRRKVEDRQAELDRAADTVERHVRQHLERLSREVTDGHWKQTRRNLNEAVAAWSRRTVQSIARRDIRELVEEVAEQRGPIAGNRMFAHLSRFFSALVERDVLMASPCVGLKRPAKETPRDRALADGEIKVVHDALTAIGGPVASCVLMCLYSGQRRGECANMRRSEICDGVWTLPAAKVKNRKQHAVPLSAQMLALIERQPVLGERIFSNDGVKPVGGFSVLKTQVDGIAKLATPWCWHDLRRTAATHMAKLGVALPVTEKVLGHTSGSFAGIVAVYQTHDYANEKRVAIERWCDHVERIVKGEEPGKVVKLR